MKGRLNHLAASAYGLVGVFISSWVIAVSTAVIHHEIRIVRLERETKLAKLKQPSAALSSPVEIPERGK